MKILIFFQKKNEVSKFLVQIMSFAQIIWNELVVRALNSDARKDGNRSVDPNNLEHSVKYFIFI